MKPNERIRILRDAYRKPTARLGAHSRESGFVRWLKLLRLRLLRKLVANRWDGYPLPR